MESTERKKKSLGIAVHPFNSSGLPPTCTHGWRPFPDLVWIMSV